MTRKALGRGLDALIPRTQPTTDPPISRVDRGLVPVDQIRPNPWQPRTSTDPLQMDELVRSVEIHGVLEPLLLRRTRDGYELVAGERRLRAAQRAGMKEVPSIIVDLDDIGSLEIALIENIQREDLSAVDEARAYHLLATEFGKTHDEIAAQVGKDRSTITNHLRLLKLPEEVLKQIAEKRLTAGHARALLALPSPSEQLRWAARIIEEDLSVREVERLTGGTLPPAGLTTKSTQKTRDPHLARVEEAIRRRVGTAVRLQVGRKGRGRLELKFADQEDLERILEILGVQVH